MSRTRTRGRRPGSPDTRALILDAARERFAAGGFAGTTVRAVAAHAGVDPALVHHYFGSKDELFVASLALPIDPRAVLAERLAALPAEAGSESPGARLLQAILSVWDDPALQAGLVAAVRRFLEPGGETLVRAGFVPVVLVPLGELLGVQEPAVRMPLVATQVFGLLIGRYLVALEPVASMPAEEVVATFAPVLDRCLLGELPSRSAT
ncbi:TetR/AcrR family transcriptional regulator [Nocardioides sambongensis]|uniref:TetR/AcrR family transcriptional regulator n=1 Tax=Nocardioides sambongensis TaxID=2589074 RepID=UPI0015E867F7|nr:TetR family transcriptional regulator [Nocardioides sambongensis]